MSMLDMVCLGDSIVYGYGVDYRNAWPYLASKRLGLSIMNKGENGDTSAATDATADIPELKPTIGGKTVEAAGKECYEISSVVTKDVMKKLPGMEEQLTNLEMFDEITAKAAMYVDVKTNLPVKFAVSADMKVNEEMAQGVKMDIKACEFSMELNYDNVDVKVPSDVKEKAIAIN